MGFFIKTHPRESNLGGEHGLENKVRLCVQLVCFAPLYLKLEIGR